MYQQIINNLYCYHQERSASFQQISIFQESQSPSQLFRSDQKRKLIIFMVFNQDLQYLDQVGGNGPKAPTVVSMCQIQIKSTFHAFYYSGHFQCGATGCQH